MLAPPAPFKDRPEYTIASKLAEDLADLLAPQSGAYYDIWLDGEKFVTSTFEVLSRLHSEGSASILGHHWSEAAARIVPGEQTRKPKSNEASRPDGYHEIVSASYDS